MQAPQKCKRNKCHQPCEEGSEWCSRHTKDNEARKMKKRFLASERKEVDIHEQVRQAGTPFPIARFSPKDLTPAMRDMMASGNIDPGQFDDLKRLFNGVTGLRAQGNQQEFELSQRERKNIAVDLVHAKETITTATHDRHMQAARAGHEVVERVITQLPDGTTTTKERVEKRNQEAVDEKEHSEVKTETREVFIARIRQYEERAISMHLRLSTLEKNAMGRRTEEAKDVAKLSAMYRWVGFAIWKLENEFQHDLSLTPNQMKAVEQVFQDTMDLVTIPLYRKYVQGKEAEIPELQEITEHFCGTRPPGLEHDFFGVGDTSVSRRKTEEDRQFVQIHFYQSKEVAQHWLKATFRWADGYRLEEVWVPEQLMRSHVPYLARIDNFMEDRLDYVTNENVDACKKTAYLEIHPTITPESLLPQVSKMTDEDKRNADVDPRVFQEDPTRAIYERRKPQPSNLKGGIYEEMARNMKKMQKGGQKINLFDEPPAQSPSPSAPVSPIPASPAPSPAASTPSSRLQEYHGLLEHMFDNITEEKIAPQYEEDMKVLRKDTESLIAPNATMADNVAPQDLYEQMGYDPAALYRHYLRGIFFANYRYMPMVLKAEKVSFFLKTPGMAGEMGLPIWKDGQVRPWVKCVFSESIMPKFQEGIWIPAIVFLWCKTLCKCRLYNCECRWRCIEVAWDAIDKAVCSHRDAKTKRSYDVELNP